MLFNYSDKLFKHLAKLFKLSVKLLVSKAKWTTNWKTRLRVLKKILGRVFYRREFLKIWGAKITIYSLKYNLIVSNLRFRLASLASIPVKTIPWSTRAVSFQLVALVTYTNYLNSDLVIDIWKKRSRNRERERRPRLNERFQSRN